MKSESDTLLAAENLIDSDITKEVAASTLLAETTQASAPLLAETTKSSAKLLAKTTANSADELSKSNAISVRWMSVDDRRALGGRLHPDSGGARPSVCERGVEISEVYRRHQM